MLAEKPLGVYCVNLLNVGTYGSVNMPRVTDPIYSPKQVFIL
jgi:hypothetical protein